MARVRHRSQRSSVVNGTSREGRHRIHRRGVVAPGVGRYVIGGRGCAHKSPPKPKQWGINVWIGNSCEPTSTWEIWGQTLLSEIKELDANAVAFTIPFYSDAHTANTYYAKQVCGTSYSTPTPTEVSQLVQLAHANDLQVFLRPYLSVANMQAVNPAYWSGNIAPTDPTTWFSNYFDALKPYLVMAQADAVEHFAISTELSSMTSSPGWARLIYSAKSIYTGNLVFTQTWQNSPNKKIWPGTSAGIDTYPYLARLKPTASVAAITAAWNLELKKFPIPGKLSSWVDDETGIAAQSGAYRSPNVTSLPLYYFPFDEAIQANWFTAACAFVKAHQMGGIYFSTALIYSNGLPAAPAPTTTFELQPLAQTAIKSCFS